MKQMQAMQAVAQTLHNRLEANGVDWATASLVLKGQPNSSKVSDSGGVAWDTSGTPHEISFKRRERKVLTSFREAMEMPDQDPWATCLLNLDRSGKSRMLLEYDNGDRWWRTSAEDLASYAARLQAEA